MLFCEIVGVVLNLDLLLSELIVSNLNFGLVVSMYIVLLWVGV